MLSCQFYKIEELRKKYRHKNKTVTNLEILHSFSLYYNNNTAFN